MYASFLSAVAAASLVCGVAQASTVNVDFAGGHLFGVRTVGDDSSYQDRRRTEATWRENGVDTYFLSHVDMLECCSNPENVGLAPPAKVWWFTSLADQDPGHDPYSTDRMVISRADGGKFNLLRVGSDGGYEGRGIIGNFLSEAGERQYLEDTGYLPLFGPSLKVSGLKEDGSIVEMAGTIKSLANWPGLVNAFGDPYLRDWFGPMEVAFDPAERSAFTNLVELTMEILWENNPPIDSITDPDLLRELGYSPEFVEGISRCGLNSRACEVPGLGTFGFGLVTESNELGYRNDLVRVDIADFDLEFVGEGGPAPVATPLPAPAALLLCGLGTLFAIRRRRTANQTSICRALPALCEEPEQDEKSTSGHRPQVCEGCVDALQSPS
jgi:hypothetical protein